ncbi:hypothetical protein T459_12199 [Capsicum annuum]|uniref:S-protein homolog n=1 Tax=Capsicum annuum TaxID=4072 RepID=A0A2G2ZP47_CAPAN|nr:hypothetical protein T459_12199 [Capsicum annuum]
MDHYPYTKAQLLLLISFIVNIVLMANALNFNPTITEYFVSDLPQNTSPLNVHCRSKDDLKVHQLKVDEKFDFSFHQNFWGNTRFHCNFEWGPKHNDFDVFYKQKSPYIHCIWLVKDSGIFFAQTNNPYPSPIDFRFVYPWL